MEDLQNEAAELLVNITEGSTDVDELLAFVAKVAGGG